jgi:protein-L-isoaspartate(D-aspartate) O-methyltransferase
MSETYYEEVRDEMMGVIAAYAEMSAEKTGRAAFAERTMAALRKVPRHEFVPAELRPMAYVDSPLPIGFDKTISQPFIVALMTDLLELQPTDKVLEVGTGLGYQSAVLAELAAKVHTIEIIEELGREARNRLGRAGYANIEFKIGDGALGWPQAAPFDKIIVTAAPELMPGPLISQLKRGGRMVIPAGIAEAQQLLLVEKDDAGRTRTNELIPVRFSALMAAE